MIRTTLVTTALTAGLLVSGAGMASAHECYIANRSAQGNTAAANSANWYKLELAELFGHAHFFLGLDEPLTPQQVEDAVDLAAERGIPTSFTVFEKFTIPRNTEEFTAKSADGKGVDHFFMKYGHQLADVVFTVVGAPAA